MAINYWRVKKWKISIAKLANIFIVFRRLCEKLLMGPANIILRLFLLMTGKGATGLSCVTLNGAANGRKDGDLQVLGEICLSK